MFLKKLFKRKNLNKKEQHKGIKKIINLYNDKKIIVQKNLRLEILCVIFGCIIISIFAFNIINGFLKEKMSKQLYISYKDDYNYHENNVKDILNFLINLKEKDIDEIYYKNQLQINEKIREVKEDIINNEVEKKVSDIEELVRLYGVYRKGNDNFYKFSKEIETELNKNVNNNSKEIDIRKIIEKYIIKKYNIEYEIRDKVSAYEGKVFLTDLEGNVKFSSNESYAEKINIYNVINKMSEANNSYSRQGTVHTYRYKDVPRRELDNSKFYSFYPVRIINKNYYLIYESDLKGTEHVSYNDGSKFVSIIISFFVFIFIFLIITKKKVEYIEYISNSLREISKGTLDYKVNVKGMDELAVLASDINYMEKEIKEKIEKERLSEKTKNELITNVSHDLRTPLTSVMGYIGLVKDGKYQNEKERKEYLNIAYNKAEKLKVLIEDLFQFTKLNNKGLKLNKNNIDINEIIRQLIVELAPSYENKNLSILDNIENKKAIMYVDGEKLSRVFENLLSNAIKYSPANETIEILSKESNDNVLITIKNVCDNISLEELDKIFERFYRTDKSRNSITGGSGIGLAISKSIINLHKGEIWAKLDNNIVSFNVKLYKERG